MTKEELRRCLLSGELMEDLFAYRAGQDCDIFKADQFAPGDEIIYIPDIYLNDVVTMHPVTDPEDIEEIVDQCYTGNDFIDECDGNAEMAERLFRFCDWQHPSSAMEDMEYDDEEEYL